VSTDRYRRVVFSLIAGGLLPALFLLLNGASQMARAAPRCSLQV